MIEVELPDGTIVEFPEGTSPDVMRNALKALTTQTPQQKNNDRAKAARAGTLQASPDSLARAASADQIAQDQMTLSSVPAGVAPITKAVQGLPFIGEFSDEITGSIGRGMEAIGLASPGTGDRAMQQQRAVQDAYGRQSPVGSAVAATTGGIVGSIPLAAAAGPAMLARAPVPAIGRVAAGAATGAAVGGAEGAVSGYGAGNDGNRAQSAAERGAIGAGLGGILGGAAPVIGAGIRRIAERLKGRDVAVIRDTLGISTDAARVIKAQLDSDDFTAAAQSIQRAGPDAMLADAGPAAGQLLDTAMQSGGAATRIGREAVETRAGDAGRRVTAMLDTVLGKPEGTRAASKSIAQRTSGIREAAYNRAFDTPIDYGTGGAGEGVLSALQRIPSRYLSQAAQKANELAQLRGVPNYRQIVVSIDNAGNATLSELPNVRQLHQLKLAMDDIARDGTDAITGKVSGDAGAIKEAAKGLRAALGDAVPAYNAAARLGGDKIAEDQALELGRKLLSTATTRETVRDSMAGASIEAKDALRRGLRQQIDEALASVQRTITDPNTDAREAMKLVKDLSSRANREKVEVALGANRAKTLFRALDEATAQLELRSSVARNSATASRLAGQEAVKEITAPGALGSLMQGEPGQAMRRIVQTLSGQTSARQMADRQAIYAEIAQALTQQRGPQAQQALSVIQAAMQGQPIKSADAVRIARVLTTGGALGSYQLGQQSLANR
jgi:hypothetical protein